MMNEADSQFYWPIVVGLIVSVLLHGLLLGAALGGWGLGLFAQAEPAREQRDEPRQKQRDRRDLGQAESRKSTVAWISHEAFRKLRAQKSATRQPAVQQKAPPVDNAPMELDPTPPVPEPQHKPQPRQPRGEPPRLTRATVPPLRGLPHAPADGPINFRPERVEKPEKQTENRETPKKSKSAAGRRGSSPEPRPQPTPNQKARPTAVPRADKSAPPADIRVNPRQFQFGQVIAREGIELQTVTPRFSAIAQVSSLGVGLPTARLKFDPSGEVLLAEMLESTGYDNIDAPILASLYKWQASGPKLEAIDQPFSITIHFTRSGNE